MRRRKGVAGLQHGDILRPHAGGGPQSRAYKKCKRTRAQWLGSAPTGGFRRAASRAPDGEGRGERDDLWRADMDQGTQAKGLRM